MSIDSDTDIWELLILRKKKKKKKTLHYHDVIEIGNICFMLERTSFSVSQRSEVFDDILFDSKTENFCFALFHLNYTELKYGEGLQSNTIHCEDE